MVRPLALGVQHFAQRAFDERTEGDPLPCGIRFRALGKVVGNLDGGLHYRFPYDTRWLGVLRARERVVKLHPTRNILRI